ncbi:hypothetical protein F6W79_19840 [Vibrio diabolicus]|uniref:hypothetical protein n=1 Tax=Vibrio diabolicus TaxID=50719 RepID=UPI00124568B7|nr:hypothetical protein [Vibrio diabolicus]KAB0317230.1 hypothetical protein F6W79_19840 [Vibrio diabolicus]
MQTFNNEVYTSVMSSVDVQEEFLSIISDVKDDLTTVLRLHLLCEIQLEAYICASVDREHFFTKPMTLSVTYNVKNKMALNLGLLEDAHSAFDVINKIRNKFSHSISKKEITADDVERFYNKVKKLDSSPIHPDEMSFTVGNLEYRVNSKATPNRIKLAILYFCLSISACAQELDNTEAQERTENTESSSDKKNITISFSRK